MQFFKFINVFTDYDMTTDMSLTGHNPNVITLYAVQANKCQSLVQLSSVLELSHTAQHTTTTKQDEVHHPLRVKPDDHVKPCFCPWLGPWQTPPKGPRVDQV